MRLIRRKTNVRKHSRQNKYVVATVRNHDRTLKPRRMLGVIPLKNLKYPQAKSIFPTLEPYGDIDQDGVINKRDCRPFDVERQDEKLEVDYKGHTITLFKMMYQWRWETDGEYRRGFAYSQQEALNKAKEEIDEEEREKERVPINPEGYEEVNDENERHWGETNG